MIHFYPESWTTLESQGMVTVILFALFPHTLYVTGGTSLRVWILEWRWALNNVASVQQPGYGEKLEKKDERIQSTEILDSLLLQLILAYLTDT